MKLKERVEMISKMNLLEDVSPHRLLREIENNILVNGQKVCGIQSNRSTYNENTSFLVIFLMDKDEFPLGFLYYNLDKDVFVPYLTNDNISIEDKDYVKSCMRTYMRLWRG